MTGVQTCALPIFSLVLVGSIAGRLLMGWLADRWPRKRVMILIYLIVAGTIPLLWAAPSPMTLRAAALALFCLSTGVVADASGFIDINATTEAVFGAGCASNALDVNRSVQNATAAALRAIQVINRVSRAEA